MSLITNTDIHFKSIARYRENTTDFIECTLVYFGKNYAEIDEIEFYNEEFKPASDMLLIPFHKYMEMDEDEEDCSKNEFCSNDLLNDMIDIKLSEADEEFREAFEALLESDDNLKYFILMYMPKIDKKVKSRYFKKWLYTEFYPVCKEHIENNTCIIDEQTADKILDIISLLCANGEYNTAFKIIMHYIYFLRTLFVMQVSSDIYHNEIAKHIYDTFRYLADAVYQIKKYGSQTDKNNTADIILNYLKSFRESGGLSFQDSYMALLGVLLTDEYEPFNKVLKHIYKNALSERYIKCALYHILSQTNAEKAAEYIKNNMSLEDVFLLAETYCYFNMLQETETVLRPRKKEAQKNSDAIDEYYNILCNAYEDSGLLDKMIDTLYEKIEDGYYDAFSSIYNEIDHNNPAELERLITNAEKYLEEDKLIEEYMFFCLYDYTLPIIEKTSDEKLLLYFTELLVEKQNELSSNIHYNETYHEEVDAITVESDIREKEIFDNFFVKAVKMLQNKQIQSKRLQHKIAKLAK